MDAPQRSVSVAGVVINDDGQALILRRRDNGHWEPPGGVLELGETITAGLIREIAEETGLDVKPIKQTGVYNNIPRGIIALVFRCQTTGGQLRTNDEATAFRWATPDEIPDLMTEAYAIRVLDAYRDDGPQIRDHDGVRLL
jgi:ADP-ribose pyrophosphatase YjhB (NUDIX family)